MRARLGETDGDGGARTGTRSPHIALGVALENHLIATACTRGGVVCSTWSGGDVNIVHVFQYDRYSCMYPFSVHGDGRWGAECTHLVHDSGWVAKRTLGSSMYVVLWHGEASVYRLMTH